MPPKQAPVTSPRDQRPSKSRPASSPVKNTYLLAYNAVSAALWAGVLYKTVTIGAHEIQTARKAGSFFGRNDLQSAAAGLASGKVFAELDGYTRMVQSLAGLEVLHSLLGMLLSQSEVAVPCSSTNTDGFESSQPPPTPLTHPRHCPRPPPHYPHASSLPLPPRLGHRLPLPGHNPALARLQHHAARLVLHRSRALQLLRLHALWTRRACPTLVSALQHLHHPVSAWYRERVLARVQCYPGCEEPG
jgi:hypothetical protein